MPTFYEELEKLDTTRAKFKALLRETTLFRMIAAIDRWLDRRKKNGAGRDDKPSPC